jgi:glycerol-3-phosphate acyltransferase PlsY
VNGVVLSIVIGYLLGSCPFGYWAGRLRGVDLRKEGSGNTGGTNAVRVLGPAVGVPVIMLDVLKGTAAVLVAAQLGGVGSEALAGAAAVVGHTFRCSSGSAAARLWPRERARCWGWRPASR